ncbi:DDE-type integrase/transposase/recombinase, partial [Nonomuraea sp. NPDC049784]|uniref:DNA-binding domain-containing protein n=1 Tax=Nonomuraea sp. NPDC049784 TaxID=3154361 RepID=UPI0033ED51F3
MRDGEDPGMDGGRAQIIERGVLTAPDEAWDVAVRQAEVIGRLAAGPRVGLAAADAAADELGISRRHVYVLLGRWRAGEGVVSDLLPRRSSGGQGRGRVPAEVEAVLRDVISSRYLNRQRRSVAAVYREIVRRCRAGGLPVPARSTLERRIEALDPAAAATAREGADGARRLRSAGGDPPSIEGLLQQVQIDHTPVDLEVVDGRYRLPIGRPYVTVAIDVASRCVVGLVVTLEAPSALSAGLCLAHTVCDKRPWLERIGLQAVAWPMSGKPHEIHVDNATEFRSEALRRGCAQHGITLTYRPKGMPHFGGIIERLIGTMMQMVHELPGTTFSNPAERGSYDSQASAVLTVTELNRWLALAVAAYHGQVHSTLGQTPAGRWAEGV